MASSTKYGTLPSSSPPTTTTATGTSSFHPLLLPLLLVLLLGSANALIFKTMYQTYGENGAFFVSTGVNFFYIIYGGLLLYPRMCLTDAITPAMKALPKKRFVIMGFLDCCGTFLAAMGAVYTPGSVQTLLNQTLIPITMLVSAVYLKTRFSSIQLVGASLVLCGAGVVVLPSFYYPSETEEEGERGGVSSRWWANTIFFLSNVPVACSQVYKERAFKQDRVDVLYLTQWVSIYQFFFGLLLAPLQVIPGVGSAHGVSLSSIVSSFVSSWHCFWGVEEGGGSCGKDRAFWLLVGYCAVNLVFNTAGLFVSKHGSAILNVCTYALLLPITTLLFSFHPLMGVNTEPLRSTTILGLVSVVLGFYLYQSPVLRSKKEEEVEEEEEEEEELEEEEEELEEEEEEEEEDRLFTKVPSFQERVVAGLGPAILQPAPSHVHRRRRRKTNKEEERKRGSFGDV